MKKKLNGASRDSKGNVRRFARLYHDVVHEKLRGLSFPARVLYDEMICAYNGQNNGEISFGRRKACDLLGIGPNTAVKAFRQLIDAGLIEPVKKGWFSPRYSKSTEWRIVDYESKVEKHINDK